MYRLSGLIFPFVLLGCESILEIELERVPSELVVTSLFTENTPWQVVIQRTVGVQEDLAHPSIIDHAIVTIEGSNGSSLELVHRGGGFYYGHAPLPRSGVMYTLRVEAEGYRNVKASDQMPLRLKPPDVQHTWSNERSAVTLYDEAGVENYYAISMLSRNIDWELFSVLNSELDDQMKRFSIEDPFSPRVNRPHVSVALIHDRPFDGKPFELSLSRNLSRDDLTTYINSISKAYYDYYVSKVIQKNAEHLSIVEPAPVKSNIHGGKGVFAGYSLHVNGDFSPENIKNQIIGTYDLRDTQMDPSDSTIALPEISFTLHPDQSVTGSMRYDSQGSTVLTSLDGGYTVTYHGSYEYLVWLHHDTDTFFKNSELRISRSEFSDPRIRLRTQQEAKDRDGRHIEIQRTFWKREADEEE